MKKSIQLFFAVIILLTSNSIVSAVDVAVSLRDYTTNDEDVYAEISYLFIGESLLHAQTTGQYAAAVDVLITFNRPDGTIDAVDKYRLTGPAQLDSLARQNFIDVRRYNVSQANYKVKIELRDAFLPSTFRDIELQLDTRRSESQSKLSDLSLLLPVETGGFEKYGIQYEPVIIPTIGAVHNSVIAYSEYEPSKDLLNQEAIAFYSIYDNEKNEVFRKVKKLNLEARNILVESIPLVKLDDGEYSIHVKLLLRNKKEIGFTTLEFYRDDPYKNLRIEGYKTVNISGTFVELLNEQNLEFSLRAIRLFVDLPTGDLLQNVLRNGTIEEKRKFVLTYWALQNRVDPYEAFKPFMSMAAQAHARFGDGVGYGFETDRGYVFMKYGLPDDAISRGSEQGAPPFIIWTYNRIPKQGTVKFLFYNPTLDGEEFDLLHSTADEEIQNKDWPEILYSKSIQRRPGEAASQEELREGIYGREAVRLFNDQ